MTQPDPNDPAGHDSDAQSEPGPSDPEAQIPRGLEDRRARAALQESIQRRESQDPAQAAQEGLRQWFSYTQRESEEQAREARAREQGQGAQQSGVAARHRTSYPSDLTDEQWEEIEPFVPDPVRLLGDGNERYERRDIVDAVRYLLGQESQPDELPDSFPPLGLVLRNFDDWTRTGQSPFLPQPGDFQRMVLDGRGPWHRLTNVDPRPPDRPEERDEEEALIERAIGQAFDQPDLGDMRSRIESSDQQVPQDTSHEPPSDYEPTENTPAQRTVAERREEAIQPVVARRIAERSGPTHDDPSPSI